MNDKTAKTKPDDLFVTTLKVSVHRRGVNPIFGESAIHVSVDDEAGGPFIVLSSNAEGQENGLRIDLDELEAVTVVARKLVSECGNKESK